MLRCCKQIFHRAGAIIHTVLLKCKYGKAFQCKGLLDASKSKINIDCAHIEIHGRVRMREGAHISAVAGGNIIICGRVSFNRNCSLACRGRMLIQDNCSIGPGVYMYDHDHKYDINGLQEGFKVGEIVIGKNCWIGAGVIILRNTHIGDNCVIGAGCVVKGDIPPNSLVTQNRELVIKTLKR